MLVGGFREHLGCLKQHLAGPDVTHGCIRECGGGSGGGKGRVGAVPNATHQVLYQAEGGFNDLHVAVVFGMPEVLDAGQANVFVGAAVAGDHVGTEGLEGTEAVGGEEAHHAGVIANRVVARRCQREGETRYSRSIAGQGEGAPVVEEGVAHREQGEPRGRQQVLGGVGDFHQGPGGVVHRQEAGGVGERIQPDGAIGVGLDLGGVAHVVIVQREAELGGVGLDVRPAGHAAETGGTQVHHPGDRLVEKVAGGGGFTSEGRVLQQVKALAGVGAVVLGEVNVR